MSRKKSGAARRKARAAATNNSDSTEAFSCLPLEVVVTHILSADSLPDPIDLARLSAVSRAMRAAVKATGRKIKEHLDWEAAKLGYLSTCLC